MDHGALSLTRAATVTTTHTFLCAACGADAATVTYAAAGEALPDDAGGPGSDNSPVTLPYPSIRIAGGPVPVTIAPVKDEPGVVQALDRGDAAGLYERDPEYAPFWCPQCRAPTAGSTGTPRPGSTRGSSTTSSAGARSATAAS